MTPDDLNLLVDEIARNVARNDNFHHPVFRGCYDWHSSIQGLYALYLAGALTKSGDYSNRAESFLKAADFAGELRSLNDTRVTPDVPAGKEFAWLYGYSWLLRLAVEYSSSRISADNAILPLAEDAAHRIDRHIHSLSTSDIQDFMGDAEYRNLSWKIICLRDWCRSTKTEEDHRTIDWLRAFVRREIMPAPGNAFQGPETEAIQGFFSPSLMRALLLLSVLPEENHGSWLPVMRKSVESLDPVSVAPGRENAHTAGLNFSRAWGLAALYAYTGDEVYAASWTKHVGAQMAHVRQWTQTPPDGSGAAESLYKNYLHWVPQFGILAAYFGQQASIVSGNYYVSRQANSINAKSGPVRLQEPQI
ncbi:MAG: DUF2891 family protein [Proteobacteria bacterium]|nr:DUF2891 family protein [Pseudomonadota bacterium]